jgi:hypothetical protein
MLVDSSYIHQELLRQQREASMEMERKRKVVPVLDIY